MDLNNLVREGERINEINDALTIIEKSNGLLFGTDALLLAGYIKSNKNGKALELGGGSGVISLLLATRNKFCHISCVEIQQNFYDLIRRNILLNNLDDKITAINADIRDDSLLGSDGSYDAVFSNPPYMKTDSGAHCDSDEKNIARHEIMGGIGDFCRVAAKKLKFGGKFYCVYRPDRLPDLIYYMKENKIEPKAITLVFADEISRPSLCLVTGTRGGKGGCTVTRPLFMYSSHTSRDASKEIEEMLESGELNI